MDDLQQRLDSALDALTAGNASPARAFFDEVGHNAPDISTPTQRAKFWELAGGLAMWDGKGDVAKDAYEQMIRYEKRAGESLSGLGNSYGKLGEALAALGRNQEAIEAFREGIAMMVEGESRPAFIATLNFQLAECLHADERYRDAAMEYRNTLARAEDEPDARSLGFLNYRLACALEPLALFQQTVRQVKELSEHLAEMGIENDELSAILAGFEAPAVPFDEEAAAAFRKALEHLSDASDATLNAQVHRDFGKLLRHMNNFEASERELMSALNEAKGVDQNDHEGLVSSIHIELGHVALSQEAWIEALNQFATVLELATGWEAQALQGASRAALGAGAEDKAIEFATDAINLLADDMNQTNELAAAYENLSEIYASLEREEEAECARTRAEEVRGDA